MVRHKHFDHAFDRVHRITEESCICWNPFWDAFSCPASILIPQATGYAYAMENCPDRPEDEYESP